MSCDISDGGIYGMYVSPVKAFFRPLIPSTLPRVSEDKSVSRLHAALVARLKAIPDGQVSQTARAAGLQLRQLMRLRAGENVNVTLGTLERIARGLGKSPSELLKSLEESAGATYEQTPAGVLVVDQRKLERLRNGLSGIAAQTRKVVAQLDGLVPAGKRRGA
jgi:transcriptional regulator with XRE-family HTH domain